MDETATLPQSGIGPLERTIEENVETIRAWERATLLKRSTAERLGDVIVSGAASAPALIIHTLWFAIWVIANVHLIPGLEPFDPFPFPFLTMTVSLEAIFLTLFVLASQNRLARESDLRSELDLQVNLLTEREMTTMLKLLQDLMAHLQVPTSVTADQIRDLTRKTDVASLAARMEEFAKVASDSSATMGASKA